MSTTPVDITMRAGALPPAASGGSSGRGSMADGGKGFMRQPGGPYDQTAAQKHISITRSTHVTCTESCPHSCLIFLSFCLGAEAWGWDGKGGYDPSQGPPNHGMIGMGMQNITDGGKGAQRGAMAPQNRAMAPQQIGYANAMPQQGTCSILKIQP